MTTDFSGYSNQQDYFMKQEVPGTNCPAPCPAPQPTCAVPAAPACAPAHKSRWGGALVAFGLIEGLIIFMILTSFIWLILYSLRPGWVKYKGTDTLNLPLILLVSVVIAIVIVIILWLLFAAFAGSSMK